MPSRELPGALVGLLRQGHIGAGAVDLGFALRDDLGARPDLDALQFGVGDDFVGFGLAQLGNQFGVVDDQQGSVLARHSGRAATANLGQPAGDARRDVDAGAVGFALHKQRFRACQIPDRQADNGDEQNRRDNHPRLDPASLARSFGQRRAGEVWSGLGMARSFDVGQIEQSAQPVGEPCRDTMGRHGFVDVGRGDQLARLLTSGERSAQLVRNLRPGFQHRREIVLGQFVRGDRDESLERCLCRMSGQHPDLAEMIAGADAQELDLALLHAQSSMIRRPRR